MVTALTVAIGVSSGSKHPIFRRLMSGLDVVVIVLLSMFILWADSTTVDTNTWGSHPLIVFSIDRTDNSRWNFDIKTRLNIDADGEGILTYRLVASYTPSDNPDPDSNQPPSEEYCKKNNNCDVSSAAADVSVSFVAPPHARYDMAGIRCGDGEPLHGQGMGNLPGTFDAVRVDAISGTVSARYPTTHISESDRKKRIDEIDKMILPSYTSRLGISYQTYVNTDGVTRYYMPDSERTISDSGIISTEQCTIPRDVLWKQKNVDSPFDGILYALRDTVIAPSSVMRVPVMMAVNRPTHATRTLQGFAGIVNVNDNVDSHYSLSSNVSFSSNWGSYWSYDYNCASTDAGILYTDMPNVFLTPQQAGEQRVLLISSLGILWPLLFILSDSVRDELKTVRTKKTTKAKTGSAAKTGKAV